MVPGLASPAYLEGNLAGDNDFDPLGFAEDPANLKWYMQAELQNGRWAMLGLAGMLIPDLLKKIGVINVPAWYDAGKVRRWQDIKYPGSVNADAFNPKLTLPPGEVGYPGGIFNPFKFPTSLEYKEKEIANGRLAMLAFLGFVIQHNITRKSPVDNLFTHLADPWHDTII
ncbi:hypothetical protein GOP47_0005019 [Adiantum capillus-veneris]|uniref:Chlorophyll a-b binding protein, chloroplastic n=1 Tax=Adiantum capillus-veneris TaxID=13818 RepID=A0A9D4ZNS2_ADICA|nr:hypothetical protein GOP47_0005019 [Adiantum capillus-veneris]